MTAGITQTHTHAHTHTHTHACGTARNVLIYYPHKQHAHHLCLADILTNNLLQRRKNVGIEAQRKQQRI